MSIRIDHAAMYVTDLERSRQFYSEYFGGEPGERYHNPRTGLTTYFLTFDSGARLELMNRPDHTDVPSPTGYGWAHVAFSVPTMADVDALAARLKGDGYELRNGPRVTGDLYYEAVFGDPDGIDIEIAAEERPSA